MMTEIRIPRILHLVWVGPKPRPRRTIESWFSKHHGWERWLWTSTDELVLTGVMHKIPQWHGKADLVRWSALYAHGGIAVDADSECFRPLDDRFLERPWTAYENEDVMPGLLACGAMGFTPQHPVVADIIGRIRGRDDFDRLPPWKTVGPGVLTECAKDRLSVFPSGYFYPMHHTGNPAPPCDEAPFAHQLWCSTAGAGDYNRLT